MPGAAPASLLRRSAAALGSSPLAALCWLADLLASPCPPACSYNYYVPASILGLRLDGGEGDAARLALLRAAWERFQGTHPFHNYTKRRLYRDEAVHGDGRRKGRRDGRGGGGADGEDASAGSSSEGEEEETGTPEASSSGGSSGAKSEGALSSSDVTERPRGQLRLEWKAEKDAADLVVRRHFRYAALACGCGRLLLTAASCKPLGRTSRRPGLWVWCLPAPRYRISPALPPALCFLPSLQVHRVVPSRRGAQGAGAGRAALRAAEPVGERHLCARLPRVPPRHVGRSMHLRCAAPRS